MIRVLSTSEQFDKVHSVIALATQKSGKDKRVNWDVPKFLV